jgi:hypothetical protein
MPCHPHYLYRFSKINSEIRKGGISGCRKKRSYNGTFFDNHYTRRGELMKFLDTQSNSLPDSVEHAGDIALGFGEWNVSLVF